MRTTIASLMLIAACVVLLLAFAENATALDTNSCRVPPGYYMASSLGVALDQLVITVGSGELTASYVIPKVSGTKRAMKYWLDNKNATATCYGDNISLDYKNGEHVLSLQGRWNGARQGIDIHGQYSGLPSETRALIKGALLMGTLGGILYVGHYLDSHQDDIQYFMDRFQQAQQFDTQFFAHPMMEGITTAMGVDVSGTAMSFWRYLIQRYFFEDHLYDFTLPTTASLMSFIAGCSLSLYDTYQLSGFGVGVLRDDVTDSGPCRISDGFYEGWITDNPFDLWHIAITLSQGLLTETEITNVAAYNRSLTVRPIRFQCQGDRLSLEWLESKPYASKGKLVLFHNDKGALEGSGVVTPLWSWLWSAEPVVMTHLRLLVH